MRRLDRRRIPRRWRRTAPISSSCSGCCRRDRSSDAQAAVIGSGVAVIFQFALFLMLGIGLWAFYGGRAFPTPDAIFPTFIVEQMPHGLVGLLLAAVLAATMSTHSGAINSLAAATTHDIYLPFTGTPRTTRARCGRPRSSRWCGASC